MEEQLKHRIAMMVDDLNVVIKFINEHNLNDVFNKPSSTSDRCMTNIDNILIAGNLHSDESLDWKPYAPYAPYADERIEKLDLLITTLKESEGINGDGIDGETMEYIIKQCNMEDQMLKQLSKIPE